MVTLSIGNSFSQISGLSTIDHSKLKKILSYSIDKNTAFFSGNYHNKIRYLIDRKGIFPTGLLNKVIEFIKSSNIKYTQKDDRVRPKRMEMTLGSFNLDKLGLTPYEDQIKAVKACLESIDGRGTISMPTGCGKSITFALLVHKLNLKTLIVVPNLELKRQLTDSFINYFGSLKGITIENIDSKNLKKKEKYDVLIIDEAHHTAARTYRDLNKNQWSDIYHRFFFTATPFRNDPEEQLLYESISGQVIYQLDYKEAVSKGYIVPVEAYYIDIPRTDMKGSSDKWASVYSKLVVNNQVRNSIIQDLLVKLHVSKCPTLCLVKEIEHGEKIASEALVPFIHGGDKSNLDNFINGHISTIVGTTGVLGEGIDTRPTEVIIIAGLGKSKPQFMQQVGRGVRRYPGKGSCQVIIFRDPSHKFTVNHFNAQVKYLKEEYGVKIMKLDL